MIIKCLKCNELMYPDFESWGYKCEKCGLVVTKRDIAENVISENWKVLRRFAKNDTNNLHSDKQK